MRKIYKIFYLVLLFFLFSCHGPIIPNEVIRVIEIEDDNLCMMEGVEFKYQDTRMIYWECRLRIMDQRINGEFDNYGYSQLYKSEFKRLRKIIKNRIKEQKQMAITEINNSIEEKEHNYCVMLKNQNNNDSEYDYFKCRDDLEKLRKGKIDFSNSSNEYIMKIFEYENETETSQASDNLLVNKECIKYVGDKNKLNKCQNAIVEVNKCFTEINDQLVQRNIDDKIYCTKVSLEKYPDSLAKFNNTNSQDFSLGPRMNKIDVLDLREKEFQDCYRTRLQKISSYKDYLEDQCKIKHLKNINESD